MLLKHSDYILKILTFQSHLRYYLSNKLKALKNWHYLFRKANLFAIIYLTVKICQKCKYLDCFNLSD